MYSRYQLGLVDYVVIGLTFIISTVIGLWFQFSKNRQRTAKEYLQAGKNMSLFPVIMSITATMLSAATILSYPMETYRFGMKTTILTIAFLFGIILSAVIFTPVYFNCNVSTSYEYLKIRFGKTTRYVCSAVFMLQMILFMSVVLYAPVLAVYTTTGLSIETSIIVFGLVSSIYCSLGGLKGVLWTDVFQSSLMFLCLITVYVYTIPEAGGVVNIYKTALKYERLDLFDFSVDFTKRFTFLNCIFRGIISGIGNYGISQLEVQRSLSLSTTQRAQSALYWSLLPIGMLCFMCNFLGLVLFTVFNNCDPLIDKVHTGLTKYDQVIPYYIVTRLHSVPGLTGVCVAGIFSGSLSTFSSALNSLATVAVLDFIKPMCKTETLTDVRIVYIAKALSMLFGLVCIGFTFLLTKVDSILAIASVLLGIAEGPAVALYIVGMLTRRGSEKCIIFGLILGYAVTGWIGYGILFSGFVSPSLPVRSSGCLTTLNSSEIIQNLTTVIEDFEKYATTLKPEILIHNEPFILYKTSFMWISTIGVLITLCFIFLAILFTGSWRHNVIPANSKCLSPITTFWMKTPRLQDPLGTSEEQIALTTIREYENNINIRI